MTRFPTGAGCLVSLLFLVSCGANKPVEIDEGVLWSGGTNQVRTGGNWFTFVFDMKTLQNTLCDVWPQRHHALR